MVPKLKHRPRLLSSTRPGSAKPAPSLSSKKTRSVVRGYHVLLKKLAAANAKGDTDGESKIQEQIDAIGGLKQYQEASKLGQSLDRGGDTSEILMQCLSGLAGCCGREEGRPKLKLLEVGALKPDNACSLDPMLQVERIDLRSQHPMIKEQDFMKRPLPVADDEYFDIVSLSLVLNFVSDPAARGEMLRHVGQFLKVTPGAHVCGMPALFLVLPAPCLTNSRYLNADRFMEIMKSLGYTQTNEKISAKLVYQLWSHVGLSDGAKKSFKKEELRSGKSRNNFAIILR